MYDMPFVPSSQTHLCCLPRTRSLPQIPKLDKKNQWSLYSYQQNLTIPFCNNAAKEFTIISFIPKTAKLLDIFTYAISILAVVLILSVLVYTVGAFVGWWSFYN